MYLCIGMYVFICGFTCTACEYVQCLWGPEEDVATPGTGVASDNYLLYHLDSYYVGTGN